MKHYKEILVGSCLAIMVSCGNNAENKDEQAQQLSQAPNNQEVELITEHSSEIEVPEGMVWIPGGKFQQGAKQSDELALDQEKPAHPVAVDGFFMKITEVTNREFKDFVKETGYITLAERPVDWDELKQQLPPGTPKPHDSLLRPGSLLFKKPNKVITNHHDFLQWWEWKIGANWQQPQGPGSSIDGKDDYPVVHIAYEDALAYCDWSGTRLPTEAEWEYAAGGGSDNTFSWGDDISLLPEHANTWNGTFPVENTELDGFEGIAPVKTYPANPFGLFDMAGNVWELTSDWLDVQYYKEVKNQGLLVNPTGAKTAFNPHGAGQPEKVIKGGSYLCNASYCASFRVSARMGTTTDSSLEHVGFRTVKSLDMF